MAELKKDGINLVLHQNVHGRIYGTTFIDHQNKAVFNGSDLGKLYTANAMIERISSEDRIRSFLKPVIQQKIYLKAHSDKLLDNYLQKTASTNFLRDSLDKFPT
ncbi:hypothetical protein AQ505_09470 [Pedobacter sp. PACM 27299]|uniref:hypothetical protein n=1 Tax=Pedobacter sp. PACM 27299 TaxID=1727164 RepID=UPI0007066B0D|nr:hypothetical protein [Pedobacter sp. PACM 27299]ALL05699.1 hypothetical protein AQ505_09470 [Pedobacter sp. PACM 27299]